MKSIKIPYALKDGKAININEVESGLFCNCYCPICNGKLVARKGKKKIHHFSHYKATTNCSAESILHYWGKHIVYERLIKNLKHLEPLIFKWDCDICYDKHEGNVLKKADKICIEKSLENCRPDITVFNKDNKAIIAIEVVVTHAPEDATINFCNDNNIYLFQINLKTEDDLLELEKEIINCELKNYLL